MFNDRYCLTRAVLEGRKTMTRRVITNQQAIYSLDECEYMLTGCFGESFVKKYSRYQIGEEVAVAQNYKDVYDEIKNPCELFSDRFFKSLLKEHKGANNKMFVKANLMPHRIRITDIKVERLQDISDEDCLREGIYDVPFVEYSWEDNGVSFDTPREAFAALIDKVSGKGTWESNPWVFVYSFELLL